MKTVYTENGLRRAMEAGESKILIKGRIANAIAAKQTKRQVGKAGLLGTAVAAATAIPFTGGASIPALASSIAGLTIGTVTISALELTVLCGLVLGVMAIRRGYHKIKLNPDGSVEIAKD